MSLEPTPAKVSMTPPPIPRRGDFGRGSSGGSVVSDNVMRARQQVSARRNRDRAPVARRTGAIIDRREQDRIEQSAEEKFRGGNIREAVASATARGAERARTEAFQNRSGRLTSSAIARERARLEDARSHGQKLTQELLLTAIAKRRFGGGLPDLSDPNAEANLKQYLSEKYGGEQNAKAQADLFGRLLGELPLPKKGGSQVIGTRTTRQPQPEPEPEIRP